jgi:hypothetical protein
MIKIFDDNNAILAIRATQYEYDLEGDWNLNGVIEFLQNRLKREVKTNPRWETPEQYEKRTGKKWLYDWAVYFKTAIAYSHGLGDVEWGVCRRKTASIDHDICVVATEAGPPPDDWRPEEPSDA